MFEAVAVAVAVGVTVGVGVGEGVPPTQKISIELSGVTPVAVVAACEPDAVGAVGVGWEVAPRSGEWRNTG